MCYGNGEQFGLSIYFHEKEGRDPSVVKPTDSKSTENYKIHTLLCRYGNDEDHRCERQRTNDSNVANERVRASSDVVRRLTKGVDLESYYGVLSPETGEELAAIVADRRHDRTETHRERVSRFSDEFEQ